MTYEGMGEEASVSAGAVHSLSPGDLLVLLAALPPLGAEVRHSPKTGQRSP